MAHQAKKTEHAGTKKGKGAYWGRKKDAKKESNRRRREIDKESIIMRDRGKNKEPQTGDQDMKSDRGEIILYQSEDGNSAIDVHLKDETVWLTQAQISSLFATERSVVTKHINNVFRTGELDGSSVCAKFAHTARDGKTYQTNFYNLDMIIALGYRVNAKRGTQFRIWATSVLKEHLVRGYSLNQRRLVEKGTDELRQALALLADTLESHNLVSDEGRAVLKIVNRYAKAWKLLLQYDEDNLPDPAIKHELRFGLGIEDAKKYIATLKQELIGKGEASEIFGQEHDSGLAGIIGAVQQTFGGKDLYPSVEEKAAHLLYFVIKDHPFTDGNKRIGSFLFMLFLEKNGLLEQKSFDNKALVALALLTAASDAGQKELLVRLVMNLLTT